MRYGHLVAGVLFAAFALGLILMFMGGSGDAGKIGVSAPRATSSATQFYKDSLASTTPSTTVSAYTTSGPREVIYTDNGFSPANLTITRGETVNFLNRSSSPFEPTASTEGGGSSAGNSCGNAFGACAPIISGGMLGLRFDNYGTWEYYNFLKPAHRGTILVK